MSCNLLSLPDELMTVIIQSSIHPIDWRLVCTKTLHLFHENYTSFTLFCNTHSDQLQFFGRCRFWLRSISLLSMHSATWNYLAELCPLMESVTIRTESTTSVYGTYATFHSLRSLKIHSPAYTSLVHQCPNLTHLYLLKLDLNTLQILGKGVPVLDDFLPSLQHLSFLGADFSMELMFGEDSFFEELAEFGSYLVQFLQSRLRLSDLCFKELLFLSTGVAAKIPGLRDVVQLLLPQLTLCNISSLVCKTDADAQRTSLPTFLTELELYGKSMKEYSAESEDHTHVTSLKVLGFSLPMDFSDIRRLDRCLNLQSLSIQCVGNMVSEDLEFLHTSFPRLHSISLNFALVLNPFQRTVILPSVQKLKLTGGLSTEHALKWLTCCPHLTYLYLDTQPESLDAIRGVPNLLSFACLQERPSIEGLAALARNCPSLRSLKLFGGSAPPGCDPDDFDTYIPFDTLLDDLSLLVNLRRLALHRVNMTSDSLRAFFKNAAQHLHTLRCTRSQLDDECFRVIMEHGQYLRKVSLFSGRPSLAAHCLLVRSLEPRCLQSYRSQGLLQFILSDEVQDLRALPVRIRLHKNN